MKFDEDLSLYSILNAEVNIYHVFPYITLVFKISTLQTLTGYRCPCFFFGSRPTSSTSRVGAELGFCQVSWWPLELPVGHIPPNGGLVHPWKISMP